MGEMLPLFARQPIFDRNMKVMAYELLFRGGLDNMATFADGDQATSHVLVYAFGQHHIEDIIGDVPAFINFTSHMLVFPPPLPPSKLVVEVLNNIKVDDYVLEGIRKLKQYGFIIALEDYFIKRDTQELLKLADIIKINTLNKDEQLIKRSVDMLKPFNAKLLAEKIETHEMFERCKDLNFDYFQGFFLSKPKIVKGMKISESKRSVLRMLAALNKPDAEIKEVVDAISSDASLSYRILKIVNSSASGLSCEVRSLAQAVSLLGLTQIRNWATFLVLATNNEKPRELSILGMTRGKFCEQIGMRIKDKNFGEMCFTTGVLSTFDASMDIDITELINGINLAQEVIDALMSQTGLAGEILDAVTQIEKADWQALQQNAVINQLKLSDTELNDIYGSAVTWATKTLGSI